MGNCISIVVITTQLFILQTSQVLKLLPISSGGRHVNADRYESSPYAAMKSTGAVVEVAHDKVLLVFTLE